jgi:hypothetical protein
MQTIEDAFEKSKFKDFASIQADNLRRNLGRKIKQVRPVRLRINTS